jgi:hypothetical protein
MNQWNLIGSAAALILFCGCQTHANLCSNSAAVVTTLTDVNYRQILDNVALFTANPDAMPAVAVFNAGTVNVQDSRSAGISVFYSPTLPFSLQGGTDILNLTPGVHAQRQVTENWTMLPVTDSDNLRRLRCAFQYLVLGDQPTRCEHCRERLERFFVGDAEDLECLLPRNWYSTGTKKDVPRSACYVGRHCDTYVWVTPEGRDGLTRFTVSILDLATGKPHAPIKTVVKTYKADGSVDHIQVTTMEIDHERLEKMRTTKELAEPERPRPGQDRTSPDRGLYFVPR